MSDARDKRIAKLERKVARLREQLAVLRYSGTIAQMRDWPADEGGLDRHAYRPGMSMDRWMRASRARYNRLYPEFQLDPIPLVPVTLASFASVPPAVFGVDVDTVR